MADQGCELAHNDAMSTRYNGMDLPSRTIMSKHKVKHDVIYKIGSTQFIATPPYENRTTAVDNMHKKLVKIALSEMCCRETTPNSRGTLVLYGENLNKIQTGLHQTGVLQGADVRGQAANVLL